MIEDKLFHIQLEEGISIRNQIRQMLATARNTGPETDGGRLDGPDWAKRFRVRPTLQANTEKPENWHACRYPVIYGHVDPELFPVGVWRACLRQGLGKRGMDACRTADALNRNDPRLLAGFNVRNGHVTCKPEADGLGYDNVDPVTAIAQ